MGKYKQVFLVVLVLAAAQLLFLAVLAPSRSNNEYERRPDNPSGDKANTATSLEARLHRAEDRNKETEGALRRLRGAHERLQERLETLQPVIQARNLDPRTARTMTRSNGGATVTVNRPAVLRVAVVMGTRPEIVKLAQVVFALRRRKSLEVVVVLSGQHQDLMIPFLAFFNLEADVTLDTMRRGQSLASLTAVTITALDKAFEDIAPDVVIVQGDTTTAFTAALAAFYRHIPVAHVEAGLRTWDLEHPFPEEMNRQTITSLAWRHYAPTFLSHRNLLAEGVPPGAILVTGNTGIDAMLWARGQLEAGSIAPKLGARATEWITRRNAGEVRLILVTAHRRENHDGGLAAIFRACTRLLEHHDDVRIIFPVHPNPLVQEQASVLADNPHILLEKPFDYQTTAFVLGQIDLLMTDSGGLQEESTVFSVPTLVLRTSTEREEGIVAGVAVLVGNAEEEILRHAESVLDDTGGVRARMSAAVWPYGLGVASELIADDLENMTTHTRTFREQSWLPDNVHQSCPEVLSIILPVHNGLPFLTETWESIQAQSSPCWSLIVVDDGSTDGSSEYVDQWGVDPRVKVVVHKRPGQRLPAALNSGLPFVDTKWLTWTSADNNLRPDFVAHFLNAARAAPDATLLSANHVMMNDKGVRETEVRTCDFTTPYDTLMRWSGCTAFAWSKAVGDVVGKFDTDLEMVEDWEYWVRLLEQAPAWVRIPTTLYDYRLHENTMTSTKDDEPAIVRMGQKVVARHGGSPASMFPGARLCAVASACRLAARKRFNRDQGARFKKLSFQGSGLEVSKPDAQDLDDKQARWLDAYRSINVEVEPASKRLVIVPALSLQEYVASGQADALQDYFNPLGFFDEVYLLSPKEDVERWEWGMHVLPTAEDELQGRVEALRPNAVRAYGGSWACDLVSKLIVAAPLICSVHNSQEQLAEGVRSGKVDVWSTSEALSVQLLESIPRSQIWGFTNRVDFSLFKPTTDRTLLQTARDLLTGERQLLFVEHSPESSQLIVRVLARLPERYGLTIVGPGSSPELEKLIAELGVGDRIRWHALGDVDLPRLYSAADALLMPVPPVSPLIPSQLIPANALVEALASGAIVVARDRGVHLNGVLSHGHNAVLVPKEDPESFAEMILHQEDAMFPEMRGRARASVSMFRKELVDRWEVGLYRTLMHGQQAVAAEAIVVEKLKLIIYLTLPTISKQLETLATLLGGSSDLMYLSDFTTDQAADMVSSPEWTRAAFARDPRELLLVRYKTSDMQARYATFAEFVGAVEEGAVAADLQSDLLPAVHWPSVNFRGTVVDMTHDVACLVQRLNAAWGGTTPLDKLAWENKALPASTVDAVFTPEIDTLVRRIYQLDLDMYAQFTRVSVCSWRWVHEPTDAPNLRRKLLGFPRTYVIKGSRDLTTIPLLRAAGVDVEVVPASTPEQARAALIVGPDTDMHGGAYGCTHSHLTAFKRFLDSGLDTAVMVEDDANLFPVLQWRHPWAHYAAMFPKDYDYVQLYHRVVSKKIVVRAGSHHWGTVAYIVSRKWAEELFYLIGWQSSEHVNVTSFQYAVADALVYGESNTRERRPPRGYQFTLFGHGIVPSTIENKPNIDELSLTQLKYWETTPH